MPETIGQRLRHAREERFITLEKASAETRIRANFISALEADDYSALPSAAQGRGFLRNYAEFLDINIDEIIAEMQKNAPAIQEAVGPFPEVNLVESDLPSLTDSLDEEPARPFWTKWLGRRPSTESNTDADFSEELSDEKLLVEQQNQIEADEDAQDPSEKPGLYAKVQSFFAERFSVQSNTERKPLPSLNQKIEAAGSGEAATGIYIEIGKKLRERRELISLTIEEVERHTKLRATYLKNLEEGAFDNLPSPVQTRGMLASYAAFLDMDPDTVLLRFADALQAQRREKYSETPREKIQTQVVTSMPFLRAFIAGDLIFGFTIIAVIIGLLIWWMGSVIRSQEEALAEATAPSIVDVLAATAEITPTLSTAPALIEDPFASPAASGDTLILETPTINPDVNVRVEIFAVERVFVRVAVDGSVVFEGRVSPRETQVYEAQNQVQVLTGNASALRITYNGRDLGLMGNVGEVVSRVYLISGIATPTATISPTPTVTQFVTVTPTATVTATPTQGQ